MSPTRPPEMPLIAVVAFLALFATGLQAQTPSVPVARPGDGTLDGSRIHPYTNIWNVYRVHDDGREDVLSTWWDTLAVGSEEGRRIFRRVQHVRRAAGGERYLLNEVDAKSLAPVRSLDVTAGDTVFSLRFDGPRIRGRRRIVPHNGRPGDAVSARVDLTLPEPVFDWQIWGTLITALPLREGYAVRFLAHIDSPIAPGPLIWITSRVLGSEQVPGGDGRPVDTWVVESDGMVRWRLWIAKDPDVPPIVRIRIPTSDPAVVNEWRSEAKPKVPASEPTGSRQPTGPGPTASERWVGPTGHRVRVRIQGGGSPTVVLISGLGDGLDAWDAVTDDIARFARVVSYDRPGLGASDPGPGPRTAGRMAAELHRMLQALGIQGPLILCGHSLGGSVAEIYASHWPSEVSGLLLIDPASGEFFQRAAETLPGFRESRAERARQSLEWPAGRRAEFAALDSSMVETGLLGHLPSVPVTMLIAGRHGPPPGTPLDSLRNDPLETLWRETHVAWIEAQARGRYVLDESSGHYIQREDPGLVIRVLRDLVLQDGSGGA